MKAESAEKPSILVSCYSHVSREGENFIPDHVFSYIISGSQDIYIDGKQFTFHEGDFRFFGKNQLAKFVKRPPVGGEFKTVSVRIDQEILRGMSQEMGYEAPAPFTGQRNFGLRKTPLLMSFISSLAPYMSGDGLNPMLTTMKVKEAVLLLLETEPQMKELLFDFSMPGKIDLEAYMNEHYRFNVDLNRFAYLTGRSLATFKRDFERIFHTSPNRWLQQKRLEDAYFLIKEKGWKSSDVYLEVGFKDLSHFSFAFKKAYGVAPSRA